MALPDKEWLTLEELVKRWSCNIRDILHIAADSSLDVYLYIGNLWVTDGNIFHGISHQAKKNWLQPLVKNKWEKIKLPEDATYKVEFIKVEIDDIKNLIFGEPCHYICAVSPSNVRNYYSARKTSIAGEIDYIWEGKPIKNFPKNKNNTPFWVLGKHRGLPRYYGDTNSVIPELSKIVVLYEDIKKFETKHHQPVKPAQENHAPADWKSYSLEIGKDINKAKPHLNKNQVAQIIHKRFNKEEVHGRISIPTVGNIEREGLKDWSIWKI